MFKSAIPISDLQWRFAMNRSWQALDFLTGNYPINKLKLANNLKPFLDNDALLISNSNPSYTSFCVAEGLKQITINLRQEQQAFEQYKGLTT